MIDILTARLEALERKVALLKGQVVTGDRVHAMVTEYLGKQTATIQAIARDTACEIIGPIFADEPNVNAKLENIMRLETAGISTLR